MPTKEQVREYMNQRAAEHKPPPTPEEIRRQMGWDLAQAANKAAQQKPVSGVG